MRILLFVRLLLIYFLFGYQKWRIKMNMMAVKMYARVCR